MKVQKRFIRRYGNKDYYKYIITLPPEHVQELGFKEGDELISEIKDGKIILKKK